MSFYHIVNDNFVVNSDAMRIIHGVLLNYKILVLNSTSTESVDLLVSNWTTSAIVNTKSSQEKKILATLKKKDKVCDTIRKFKEIYHENFIRNECLILVQNLIDSYRYHANLLRKTVQNLLPIMRLTADIDLVTTHSWHRLTFLKKLRIISAFLHRNLYDIIYREAFLIYLVQQRDTNLSVTTVVSLVPLRSYSKRSAYATSSIINILDSDFSATVKKPIDFTDNNLAQLILDPYLTDMKSIQSIRSVDKQLCARYNSTTMTLIAIQNLKDIIQHFFMLNTENFLTAVLSCGAIIGGSLVLQSFHGGVPFFNKKSDLHIYYPESSDATSLRSILFSSEYKYYDKRPSAFLRESLFYSDQITYRFGESILSIATFKNEQGRKIQLTAVRTPGQVSTFDFGRLVISTYDFTFLKNFFDGVDLYTFDFEGVVTKRGGISSVILNKITVSDAITESYSSFKNWYRAHTSTIVRCLKYQERGFHIDDVPTLSLVDELRV